jgi:hypothetical protein
MTGRNRKAFQDYIADFCLFMPMGIGFPFQYSEVMKMDIEVIERFQKRKELVIKAMNKK